MKICIIFIVFFLICIDSQLKYFFFIFASQAHTTLGNSLLWVLLLYMHVSHFSNRILFSFEHGTLTLLKSFKSPVNKEISIKLKCFFTFCCKKYECERTWATRGHLSTFLMFLWPMNSRFYPALVFPTTEWWRPFPIHDVRNNLTPSFVNSHCKWIWWFD